MMKKVSVHISILERIYLIAIIKGLYTTIKHFFSRKFTQQYPEEKREPYPGYRGSPKLNKDENGRIKCVACLLCMANCPSQCISIAPGPSPWPDREKYPISFEIDLLRCIFCGFCQEACPEEAIELSNTYENAAENRKELRWDKEKLLHYYEHKGLEQK
jgi:NADH-quinone oxidoreductase subunit I